MKRKIINYLIKKLSTSLMGTSVHESADQRQFALENMAKSLFYRLTKKDKKQIIEEIKEIDHRSEFTD